jgi:hypothetical protein
MELNDEINTLKKENATLLERLEDTKKVVSIYSSISFHVQNISIVLFIFIVCINLTGSFFLPLQFTE